MLVIVILVAGLNVEPPRKICPAKISDFKFTILAGSLDEKRTSLSGRACEPIDFSIVTPP